MKSQLHVHKIGDVVYQKVWDHTRVGTIIGFLNTTEDKMYYRILWISIPEFPVSYNDFYDEYISTENDTLKSAQEFLY